MEPDLPSEPLTTWDRLPVVLRAMRHRNFRLFMGGQLVSLVGTWLQMVAQQWLVYRLTGSATMLGLIAFSGQIPSFLMGPIAGTVVDRVDRHRLIVATQVTFMLLAMVLAVLTLTGRVQIWHIFALAALGGIANSFDVPGRQAFLVEMTSKEDLVNAISLNSSMFNASRMIGPAVAGLLVGWVGEGWCFYANSLSYIAVIVGLLLMQLTPIARTARSGTAAGQMLEGLRFVYRTAPIRALMLLTGLSNVLGIFYSVLAPIFADRILGGSARELGIMMGAAGAGALLGALALASRTSVKGLGVWVGIPAVVFGVMVCLFSMSTHLWLSVVLLVPVGGFGMVQLTATNTLIQVMVPDELRGRTMSVYAMMFMGMMPFGSLLAGSLAEHIGAPHTVMLSGVGYTLGGLAFLVTWPRLRPEARDLIRGVTKPG